MMKSNIKNLIIDLGVVLLDLNPSRCFGKFHELGVENIEQLVDANYKQGLFLDLEKGNVSPEEFRYKLRRITGLDLSDQQIDSAWNSFLVGTPTYKLELLLSLRQHYMVYLLSNTNAIHWEWICDNCFAYKGFRAEDFFEKMYLSYEMHLVKPDKKIFQEMLAETGINAGETFFIDDAPANCRIAESLGIETYTPTIKEDWSHLFD